MANNWFKVFHRALLGDSLFVHTNPLRSRSGMASEGWESLVSIRRRSQEEFANNRFALLFIDIDNIMEVVWVCTGSGRISFSVNPVHNLVSSSFQTI